MTATRTCPSCAGVAWQTFYDNVAGRIMTGDQRVGAGHLQKIICTRCGVVANQRPFTESELTLLYGEDYELNTLGREEHFFFTAQGPIARSQVFCDWIAPHIPGSAKTVVEVGCGEGQLLGKLQHALPQHRFRGIDGSRRAADLARAKGLDVRQQLLLGRESIEPADVFLLVNVIEHVEDIDAVIAQLMRSLRPGGRIIFCLPIQDYGGYDLFFAEHVWHVTVEQFRRAAVRNGLHVLTSDAAHPINHGIGLFVCEVEAAPRTLGGVENQSALQFKNLQRWQNAFERVDEWFDANSDKTVAVFGGGEVFTLFYAFTTLGGRTIAACIDDTKAEGSEKHGVPVHPTEWLASHPVDVLLLAVNPKYHEMIVNKTRQYGVTVYPLADAGT